MANELPEITPFNAVYQSEKYYDIEPQRATEIIKKVGGGIADIMLPQDATDVMMMAVPPVMVYNKVKKILDRANKLRAEAQSFFKSARESGSRIERETANFKNNEAARIVKAVPEDEIKIYNDYEKTLTPSKEEANKALAEIRKNLGIDPKKKNYSKGDEVSGVGQPNFLADTLSNVPSSSYQLGSDVAQAVTNPVQTLDAIGNLGLGLIALVIPDAYQEKKLDKPQEAALAVGQYVKDRYGSLEAAKETLRKDPVGVLADVSGILLGGGYLATKSGFKAGQIATKAGIATDPLVIAGRGVSEVGKGITRRDVLKGAGAGLASLAVPMSIVTDVTKSIPPVAKSTGILAGIGKFKGIMNNLEPYLLGSKRRDQMNPGKYGSNKRAEAIDKLYPEIGYSDSIGNYDLKTINTKQMSKFQKTHNLESKDFSAIDDFKMFDPIMKKTSSASENTLNSLNDAGDIFKKLDDAPDKTVTVKKINRNPSKEELLVHPDWGRRESKLTTGTVDGVPIMKNQVFQEIGDRMINMGLTFYMPNKAGLEKLAKAKPNLAKGGSVDKALYTDQKYI